LRPAWTTGCICPGTRPESFERLVGDKQVLAASFDLDGQHLWFGSYAGKAALARITLKAGSKAEEVPIPALTQDAVAYIAQNPARRAEIAIATFKRSVFVSKDQGAPGRRSRRKE